MSVLSWLRLTKDRQVLAAANWREGRFVAGDFHAAPQPGALQPSALRRAVALIDDNAGRPIPLADIAAAAGTTTRAT
ncbi:hypothetical protein [Streptomyces zhihengii]